MNIGLISRLPTGSAFLPEGFVVDSHAFGKTRHTAEYLDVGDRILFGIALFMGRLDELSPDVRQKQR